MEESAANGQPFLETTRQEVSSDTVKRSKWSDGDQTPLRVNDIVWILKDMTPRGIWPLRRVLEVYPGRDGQHRVVKVKTADGTYVRPVSALARVLAD